MKYEIVSDAIAHLEKLLKERGYEVTQESAGRGDVMYRVAGVPGWTKVEAIVSAANKLGLIKVAQLEDVIQVPKRKSGK